MATIDEIRRSDMEQRLRLTEFAVEADSFAQQALWSDYSKGAARMTICRRVEERLDRRVDWEQVGDGWLPRVGDLAGMPVCISLSWALIEGRLVLFHHATSQVVDHRMIDAWMRQQMPQLWPADQRSRTTDATNFYNIVHAIRDLNKAPEVA